MAAIVAHPLERAVGRWLAVCAHPVLAWRVASRADRCVMVAGYATLGYVAGLVVLSFWRP